MQLAGCVFAFACFSPLAAQSRVAPLAIPGSELSISVLTMGTGAEVWERFGHNAVVVEDHRRETSTAYNWGMFSFRQENFLLRFLQGRMNYWMAGYPTAEDVPRYMAAGRSVWQQELNLSPAQRLAFRDYLETNALPENRFYRYDYYRDNCSTRVRDAIDHVLGGAFHAQMTGPASGSYRFHTQRLNTQSIPIYTGLLLVLGHPVDAPRTKWEEMFLPLKLHEYLRQVQIPDSTGQLVPLVRAEQTLYESQRFPVPDAPPNWAPAYLVVGVLLGGLLWWGGAASHRSAAARWLLGAGGTLWALFTGLAGAILAGLWAFTDHVATARNENLLQVSLFALALGLVLPFARPRHPGAVRAARALAIVVGGLSISGVLLKALPAFNQVNGQILALFVPANVGLMLGIGAWTRWAGLASQEPVRAGSP
jgi:Domain of unknown function (DUF4105)